MDSSGRPLFCFSDNTSLDAAGKHALRSKAPLLRAEASRACILKDTDLDLRNQWRKGNTPEQIKGEKNLKGERKVSPRVFSQ